MDKLESSILRKGPGTGNGVIFLFFLSLSRTPSLLLHKMHLSPHPILPPVPRATELVVPGLRSLLSHHLVQKGLYLNDHPPSTNCSQWLRVLTRIFSIKPICQSPFALHTGRVRKLGQILSLSHGA